MGWWRISSIDISAGNLLLVKCSQTLSSWIKKSSLFLCQLYLRICFCLKRAKPWLEFSINQHLINTAWDLSWEHWWDLIMFKLILFLENSIECLSKMFKECLSVWEVWIFFIVRRKLYILFSVSFLIYFGIVYIWTTYQSLDKSWFIIIFLPGKERLTLLQIWSFLLNFHLFCRNWSYREKNLQN